MLFRHIGQGSSAPSESFLSHMVAESFVMVQKTVGDTIYPLRMVPYSSYDT